MESSYSKHGFIIKEKKTIKDIDSEVYEYEHIKTKAKLIFIKNKDSNMAFTIGFKTIPHDNTGVAHIIEHSVLCGSKNYPVKDPFVELMKSSLNTFLNAMTFSDMTLYPFSSQNKEDYMNILDIYMDAVYNPNMTKNKEIFMQEGWSYTINNKDEDIKINGVVYNEMKGAYSSPLRILNEEINKSLFDNCYKFSSGGNPDEIPTLSYEDFLNFYHTYYHPSNSCMYVYGDCNIEEILETINSKYLSYYDYKKIDSTILPTKEFNYEVVSSAPYSISSNDNIDKKTLYSINYVFPTSTNEIFNMSINIIVDILFNSQSAIIKTKLLEKKLCDNISASFDTYKLQPSLTIFVQNTSKDNIDTINKIIDDCLKNVVKEGVQDKILEAFMSREQFRIKQDISNNSEKGIDLGIRLINRWKFTENITDILYFNENITKLYNFLNQEKIKELIQKYLIDNKHKSKVTLYPEEGMNNKKSKKLEESLSKYKNYLNDTQLKEMIDRSIHLKETQSTPNDEETLKCIPVLKLCDIEKKSKKRIVNNTYINNIPILHYNAFTNDIIYAKLMFKTNCLTEEELPYIGLLSSILGKIKTKNYTLDNLNTEILINTGGLGFNNNAFNDIKDIDVSHLFFETTIKTTSTKIEKSIDLLKEILFESDLEDVDRISQIINMIYSNLQIKISNNGHMFAYTRLASNITKADYYLDKTRATDYFNFIKDIVSNYKENSAKLVNNLKQVLSKILNTNNLIITLTSDNKQKEIFTENVTKITNLLSNKTIDLNNYNTKKEQSEGFCISSKVQYVAQGYNYKKMGYSLTGTLKVIETILKTEFLWNNVRVIGGAYGSMLSISASGNIILVSYRDPNLLRTIEVYNEIPEYLQNIKLDEDSLSKYIIGTIKDIDHPLSVEDEGNSAFISYIAHYSDSDRQKLRDEIFNTSISKINNYSDMFKKILNKELYVVFGNSNMIKKNKKLFKEIYKI